MEADEADQVRGELIMFQMFPAGVINLPQCFLPCQGCVAKQNLCTVVPVSRVAERQLSNSFGTYADVAMYLRQTFRRPWAIAWSRRN